MATVLAIYSIMHPYIVNTGNLFQNVPLYREHDFVNLSHNVPIHSGYGFGNLLHNVHIHNGY